MKNKSIFFLILLHFVLHTCQGQTISTVAGGITGHGGYWGDGGPATAAQLGIFGGLAIDHRGNIYIAQSTRVRRVDALTGIITTIAGTGTLGYNGDGIPATAAMLNGAGVVEVDNEDNVYIGDGYNYRIRKVDITTGLISTFLGTGTDGFSGDGGPATAASIDGGAFTFDCFDNFNDYRFN